MALADLVLEGLTLILVIALGAVLIGGLTYLSTTVASANGARLVGMGTYVYIPAAVYVNGTLYVPMYNIGHYTVVVRQVFIRVGNTLLSQTLNTTLAPGQYYVYTTTLNQRPTAVTVVASPTVEPRLKLEFSANVTEPGQVTLMSMGTNTGGNGLIEVVVNDPYGAGWEVAWSYADQSYSMAQSTTYTWYLNPPYLPIQITFNAQVTGSPTGYTCQIQPSQVSGTYGPGSEQTFNVACSAAPINVTVSDNYGAGWVVTWSGTASGEESGSASASWTIQPSQVGAVNFTASITSTPSGYTGCSISPTSTTAGPGQTVNFVVSCSGQSPPKSSQQLYAISVTVDDPYNAQWTVDWNGAIYGNMSQSSSYSWTIRFYDSPSSTYTVSFTAKITGMPAGYSSCTISPTSKSVTLSGSNPTASVSFTVTCNGGTPPPAAYGCFLTYSVHSSPSGAPAPDSSLAPGTYFVPSGQSVGGTVSALSSESTSSGGGGSTWWEFVDYTLSFSGSGTLYFNGVGRGPGTWNYGRTYFSWQFVCPSGLSQNVTASFSATADYTEDYVKLSGPTSVNIPGDYTYTLSWDVWPGSATGESWSVPNPNGNPFNVVATLTTTIGTYSVSYSTSISCSNGVTPQNIQASLVSGQTGVTGTQNSATATISVQFSCQSTRTP